ncbi:HAD family hydrolase [Secundilactobacillus paracollinoides]|uniref:Acid sugar phosphatase n=1 Tax=Secundilactobacillus paracollinoides TaxID=240427 RepID=A0A1B2J1J2_9LACO|nr:TIGR01457 family HAD-type hydrolase [Secundilactobacillus paracollinoides]ANZ62267.1 HAD family hydrolase [Secundilactobacillus paracollinoides]ANZ63957.1 HAD family hydrolase [Secundilactobacillus paracollinoides]ANZ68216.1 HAD family hydrolase [Secundilactobacillus paracollinoides]
MTKHYDGYFIDLDGTIYAGKRRIPAAKRFIERLQNTNTNFMFVTNNTTKLPADVVRNLGDNHDIHVTEDNVYTAGLASADYVAQIAQSGQDSVYIVGEIGLIQAFLDRGFHLTEHDPDFVVVGLDSDVTYHKLSLAILAIRAGATFIGTNPDSNIPNELGMLPGAGSLVEMVAYATQQRPVYIGKPRSIIMANALQRSGLRKDQVVMVGDNYRTDITAGLDFGIDTLLVYTGLSTRAQVAREDRQPTVECDSLDDWELV